MKRISIIKAKIRRLNVQASATKLFDELDEAKRVIIFKEIVFLNEEEPIFCFFNGLDYWWVLTNSRLIISDSRVINYILFEEIEKIQLKDIFENKVKKTESKNIDIKLRRGIEFKLELEENTWHAVFNLLNFCINRG